MEGRITRRSLVYPGQYLDPSDESSSSSVSSAKNVMEKPQSADGKVSTSKKRDNENKDHRVSEAYLKANAELCFDKNIGGKAAAAKPKNISPSEAEASNPYSGRYPVSRQVFDLEKRAQELQEKRDYFQNQCNELTLIVERLNKATKKERSDHEAKCASLKAANDDMAKQLEEEKDKVKELESKNESLAKDLAAASERNAFLTKMLEEKTYESWIFRCALAVVFKSTPSTRERVSMRKLICDCFAALKQKYQQDRALQQGDQTQDQNNSNRVSEEAAQRDESSFDDSEEKSLKKKTAQKKRPQVVEERDSLVSSDDSEEKPLKMKAAQKKRAREAEKKDNRVSKEDSDDDDQPLFNILKRRVKKLKVMPSREKSLSFD
ncbi:hypothetical protein M431DRAFT_494261 [Trichoderma harzianum CBS 226.95]|uniref:Uncharacterized protein n=1 Tax=Trichoderma harzianum CBS 226.95 TaxID=983964 RepID=A0A2T4AFF7_TRIHA|nr:hypothetical protein M431DRAFT_494261 [Trichoderma harzianum CBS 226.95]PTB55821.1 hypothetical protein M431DRAFT_494261 [Trichoderma harzianum CBS 226.95]